MALIHETFPRTKTTFSSLAVETIEEVWSYLPRCSKSHLLQISRAWSQTAQGTAGLWTDLVFGETSTHNDLAIAHRWLSRSSSSALPLSLTVLRDGAQAEESRDPSTVSLAAILLAMTPLSPRIRTIHITGPDANIPILHAFLLPHSFPRLQSLVVNLSRYWGSQAQPSSPSTQLVFHAVQLPVLQQLHVTNLPCPWSTSSALLTEFVMGPQQLVSRPVFMDMKQALESAPLLSRLGFNADMPGLGPAGNVQGMCLVLPALTTLSVRHVSPRRFATLISVLDAPLLSNLIVAFHSYKIRDQAETTAQFLQHLHGPAIAPRLLSLTLQSLGDDCDASFFGNFTAVANLRLDFSPGALHAEYWTALTSRAMVPSTLIALRDLTLVAVSPLHAQQLVYLRSQAGHPKLRSLTLWLKEGEALLAGTPQWSAWLKQNVGLLTIVAYDSRRRRQMGPFDV
ncbi:hypothetical protein C8R46DRAFT_1346768 [Mycena filopes]|nr:hypothetical protein C8R46DRAFT_1346768 [Mycena filopes]